MSRSICALTVVVFAVIAILPPAYTISQALLGGGHLLTEVGGLLLTPRVAGLFLKTLALGCGVSVFSLAVGVPVGFLICRTDIYLKRLAQTLYLLPLAIPSYIAAIAWTKLLGPDGAMRALAGASGGLGSWAPSVYGLWGVIWVLGWSYFPFVSLLTVAGLSSADRALEEQAEQLVGQGQAIRMVTLPLAAPFMLSGALFVFVFAISNYGVPAMLRVNTYPIEIFTQYAAFYNHRAASVLALPLLLLTGGMIGLSYALMQNRCYVSLHGARKTGSTISLARYRPACSVFVWLAIMVSGILPVGVLVGLSGSVAAYRLACQASLSAIATSLGIASVSAVVCLVLGYGLAWLIERARRRKAARLLDVATVLPLAVPGTVLGIGLIEVWNRPATSYLYAGWLAMVFGMVARFLPFAVRALSSSLKQVKAHMEEAAALTGVGNLRIAGRIVVPLMKPGILASLSICFVFAMAEIDTTLLVMPPGSETLAGRIYTLMHYEVGAFTMASCVILIGLSIIPAAILSWLSARSMR